MYVSVLEGKYESVADTAVGRGSEENEAGDGMGTEAEKGLLRVGPKSCELHREGDQLEETDSAVDETGSKMTIRQCEAAAGDIVGGLE